MSRNIKPLIAGIAAIAMISSCKSVNEAKWESGEFDLAPGETAALSENFIRANTDFKVDVKCDGEFSKIVVSRGDLDLFWGADLTITEDSIKVKEFDWSDELQICAPLEKEAFAHGLQIGKELFVEIVTAEHNTKANLVVSSEGCILTREINWRGGGIPSVTNYNEAPISVKLEFLRGSICEKTWFLADSYFSEVDAERWPYYMVSEGIKEGWMADHLPGGGSKTFIACFKEDLKYGKPETAVWMLGMNDQDSDTEISAEWLECTEEFLRVCDSLDITAVLVTVPSVPERNNSFKTEWVRQSGRQYIDWTEAVQQEGTRQWKEGLLSPDDVHPSADGAKILWEAIKSKICI